MNDQAVLTERAYGRPIMASFHAFFSVGGVAGALLGASIQSFGLSLSWSLGSGAVLIAVLTLICVPGLLPHGAGTAGDAKAAPTPDEPGAGRRGHTSTIVILAGLAFLFLLSEGTANDWSALHAVDHLAQSQAAASLAFGVFSGAMTLGRFTVDRIVARIGPVAVVRFGSVGAAVAMLVVVLSPAYPLTLAGWAVFGLGLSGIVPQIFTAAGKLGATNQGVVISRVVGAGYLGLLAGPAVIGWASQTVGLTLALSLPVLCCVTGTFFAGHIATEAPSQDPMTDQPAMAVES